VREDTPGCRGVYAFPTRKNNTRFFSRLRKPGSTFRDAPQKPSGRSRTTNVKKFGTIEPENQRLLTNGAASAEKHIVAP